MYLIVGLGNPGEKYISTRHNLGFRVIDRLSKDLDLDVSKSHCMALIGQGQYNNTKLIMAKPQTFMNLSGDSVRDLISWYKIEKDHLIVIHDDLDIDIGQIKIRQKGNSAGHHGIESLINRLGTEFIRIRLGIGRSAPGGDNAKYVLDDISPDQRGSIDQAILTAAEATLVIIKDGLEAAMNRYNGS